MRRWSQVSPDSPPMKETGRLAVAIATASRREVSAMNKPKAKDSEKLVACQRQMPAQLVNVALRKDGSCRNRPMGGRHRKLSAQEASTKSARTPVERLPLNSYSTLTSRTAAQMDPEFGTPSVRLSCHSEIDCVRARRRGSSQQDFAE